MNNKKDLYGKFHCEKIKSSFGSTKNNGGMRQKSKINEKMIISYIKECNFI